MKISPSILAANLIDLKSVLGQMDPALVDLIHMDVMDGHFVPQLSFGEAYSKAVKEAVAIPLDVHLMVSRPELEIPKYFDLNPYVITFHLEATNFPIRLAQLIRSKGIKAGISLNPGTPVSALEPALDDIDMVLIMSVEPGFYGQKFIPQSMRKLEALKTLIGSRPIEVEIDGGVSVDNIRSLKEKGVGIAVAGAAVFKGGSVNDNVRALKSAAG
ncbi:MAG: ribulose-phosphate 3-epimerase [Spirochaetia bacterium]|nr:ribulose-phosphate 3-epimerase [Spirochaetia bacterium]